MTQGGGWRHEWAQAVRASAGLSMTARMVGQVLALDFANGATGQCNPSRATLADHLGVSEATIKRAIAELVGHGWLAQTTGTSRAKTATYSFLSPGKVIAFEPKKSANAGHPRPATDTRTRVKSARNAGQICTSHIRMNNVREPDARATSAGDHCPVSQAARVTPGSWQEQAWNEWLEARGFPTVDALGVTAPGDQGGTWIMPFGTPPREGDETPTRLATRFVEWASARIPVRHELRA